MPAIGIKELFGLKGGLFSWIERVCGVKTAFGIYAIRLSFEWNGVIVNPSSLPIFSWLIAIENTMPP